MLDKKNSRLRRARRARRKIRELGATRLTVHRTPKHMYAQITDAQGANTLANASTLESDLKSDGGGNMEAAKRVGTLIATRAKQAGITRVSFDRSGFKYHGRVRALAQAAREEGLEF